MDLTDNPEDYGCVVAARFDQDIAGMMDEARLKLSKTGLAMARSSFVKAAVYWYLGYLGYKPVQPEVGGRRKRGKK